MEDFYDWRYHYDIIAGESSSASYAFLWEEVYIPSQTHNPEENNYIRMVHNAAADTFWTRTKTSFHKMSTVTWRNSHLMI